MTPAADLEQEILVALLDGWLAREQILEWLEPESVPLIDPVLAGMVERGLAIRGEVSADGFVSSPDGRWLKRTRDGERRARELETNGNRGFTPRKKNGRCG